MARCFSPHSTVLSNALLRRPAVTGAGPRDTIMFSEANYLELRTNPQGRLEELVYAQHGRETNGVKVPCRRTYFIELYGDDNY